MRAPAVRGILLLAVAAVTPACSSSSGGGGSVTPAIVPVVAFIADKDQAGMDELYVANVDGSRTEKISGSIVFQGDVTSFAWFLDGTQIAFAADKDTDNVFELYVLPASGGAITKVSVSWSAR